MADPTNLDEYNKRIHLGTLVSGLGAEVTVNMPCFFCAAPGFMEYRILNMQDVAGKGATCKECGRSAKAIFNHQQGGIAFEIVQTGGPDQPEWLEPKMRRV